MSQWIAKICAYLNSHFKLDERETSISQEFAAGTATFLTMSYILLVNPQLLAKMGVPSTDIVVSTALSASIGTITVGLYGNLPFGLASGVGLSAYLTYGLVLGEGLSVSDAFTSVITFHLRCNITLPFLTLSAFDVLVVLCSGSHTARSVSWRHFSFNYVCDTTQREDRHDSWYGIADRFSRDDQR